MEDIVARLQGCALVIYSTCDYQCRMGEILSQVTKEENDDVTNILDKNGNELIKIPSLTICAGSIITPGTPLCSNWTIEFSCVITHTFILFSDVFKKKKKITVCRHASSTVQRTWLRKNVQSATQVLQHFLQLCRKITKNFNVLERNYLFQKLFKSQGVKENDVAKYWCRKKFCMIELQASNDTNVKWNNTDPEDIHLK